MIVARRLPALHGPSLALALALTAACQAQEVRGEEERVIAAAQHGRYEEALATARRLAADRPDDERVATLLRDTEVAYVLDQGRNEVFRGDLGRALELFEQARQLAPGHPTVENWIGKTRAQLANQWLDRAAAATGPDHLAEAEAAYEKVLTFDPDNADGKRGLANVLLLQNYRAGMSKTYFDDGLSSFRRLLLEQARRAFQVSNRYRENDPASSRGDQVEKMIAEERLAQAANLEANGLYFAARNEYRLVLLVDPENAEARAGLDRMDRESRAMQTMSAADMAVRRGDFEQAQEVLDTASVLTDAQEDDVSLLRSSIEDKRLDDLYGEAASLTEDYRYPEAVAAYEQLLERAPDYKDAARRKETLQEFIRLAEEFYAKALAAPDDKIAEEWLRAIELTWPEYKDVSERLAAIEARRPAVTETQPDAGAGAEDGG
jgi:tetratricopeptide (TPR) repeat protein